MEATADLWQVLFVVLLLILAFFTGSFAERGHYRSIRRREDALGAIVVVVAKTLPPTEPAPATVLVRGSVVISVDYFKRFLARLRMIFGGRIHTYESLLDRARREAILRMQERARELGATMIFNMRFETSSISKGAKQAVGTVEVLAYGTAIIPPG
jgi:uncharacterized protein YbjQ (UPF0145 family)